MPRKHKSERNRQKVMELPKNIIGKFWSIIYLSLNHLDLFNKQWNKGLGRYQTKQFLQGGQYTDSQIGEGQLSLESWTAEPTQILASVSSQGGGSHQVVGKGYIDTKSS